MDRNSAFASIKSRLIILYLIIFLISFAGLGSFLYYKLTSAVIGSIDNHLYSEVHLLASLLKTEDSHGYPKFDLRKISEAGVGSYAVPLSGHYYQIVSPEGVIIARSPSLSIPDVSLPVMAASLDPQYTIINGPDGSPLRLMSQSFILKIGAITIYAGDTLKESYQLLHTFRNTFLIIFPIVFLFFWAGTMIITGWSFGTLKIFSEKIGQITENKLNERIDERGTDIELQPLAANFNIMMGRLEDAFSRQIKFLSDASHELRTPTSIIKSYCDVTLSKERTALEYQDALYRIAETVNKMTAVISKILEISRSGPNLFLSKPSNVSLLKIIRSVIKLLEPYASTHGVKMTVKGRPLKIPGDKERLIEAFVNIIENAIKYNKEGGRVNINITDKDRQAVVSVTDTGRGMPEGNKEKIFERFYRIQTGADAVQGSGLGLSIAKSIIEAHGGRIEVASEVGKGSSFLVYLKNELPKMAKNEKIGEKRGIPP